MCAPAAPTLPWRAKTGTRSTVATSVSPHTAGTCSWPGAPSEGRTPLLSHRERTHLTGGVLHDRERERERERHGQRITHEMQMNIRMNE